MPQPGQPEKMGVVDCSGLWIKYPFFMDVPKKSSLRIHNSRRETNDREKRVNQPPQYASSGDFLLVVWSMA
jgi:hypothetical protein